VLERVIVHQGAEKQQHYWGSVEPSHHGSPKTVCLTNGQYHVRVEGYADDQIRLNQGWDTVKSGECERNRAVVVWEDPPDDNFDRIPSDSGLTETYWVEYVGVLTAGVTRRAGPFCCPNDSRQYALEDGGIKNIGQDGGYILFDKEGNVIEVGA